MGCGQSSSSISRQLPSADESDSNRVSHQEKDRERNHEHAKNVHMANPDIKIHTVVSAEYDFDHTKAMRVALGETSDEQLLAEVARRKLDLHDAITG
jgi:hypothetical protein